MRQSLLRFVVAGALASSALAACGDDGGSDGAASTPKAEASLSATQAEAIATASLVVASDLPGYTAGDADEEDTEEDAEEVAFKKCIGLESAPYLAEKSSPDFTKGEMPTSVSLSSDVSVVATAAQGKSEFEALRSDKTLGCLETFISAAFAEPEEGVTADKPAITRIEVPTPKGAEASFGFTLTTNLRSEGFTLPFSLEYRGALVQRAELIVFAGGFGETVPAGEPDRLLALMAQRAVAAQK